MILKEISVIIPCRNEIHHIKKCLNSILDAEVPECYFIRVYVIDGASTDGCVDYLKDLSKIDSRVTYIKNEKKILAAAWNIGIEASTGDLVAALNAHTEIPKSYFVDLIKEFKKDIDAVAPVLKTYPQDKGSFALAVSNMMSSIFGVGNSAFRTGVKEPRLVETGHCLIYKRSVFEFGDRFDEQLIRSQDIEFNKRIVKRGKKILLTPTVAVTYYTRSRPIGFIKFAYLNGFWVTAPLRYGVNIASFRHSVPAFFVACLIISLVYGLMSSNFEFFYGIVLLHMTAGILFSFLNINDGIVPFLLQPFVTLIYHFLYGLGSIFGLTTILKGKQ
jgi:glycosyltransferase involved in cell wall biosynthesis